MLLSIIVPTYNVEDYIANCIESLLDQDISKEDYEILIINDGATDKSPEIAKTYADKYSNVILINQENKGLSGARNTGISNAKGTYTYFIDSDDYIAKNTLALILDLAQEHELDLLGIKSVETDQLNLKNSVNVQTINSTNLKVTDGITFMAENYYLNNAWWYFIKTSFLKETGLIFPLGRLVEDANFTSKLLVATKRMAYIPLDFYRYYMRPNSIMRKTNMVHVKRLLGDYQNNVYEFNSQLQQLNTNKHPRITDCFERIKARQGSFVFFHLAKTLRYGIPKGEVETMVDNYKKIDAYPIKEFLGKDYNKLIYRILVPIFNNEKLFFTLLKLRAITT